MKKLSLLWAIGSPKMISTNFATFWKVCKENLIECEWTSSVLNSVYQKLEPLCLGRGIWSSNSALGLTICTALRSCGTGIWTSQFSKVQIPGGWWSFQLIGALCWQNLSKPIKLAAFKTKRIHSNITCEMSHFMGISTFNVPFAVHWMLLRHQTKDIKWFSQRKKTFYHNQSLENFPRYKGRIWKKLSCHPRPPQAKEHYVIHVVSDN